MAELLLNVLYLLSDLLDLCLEADGAVRYLDVICLGKDRVRLPVHLLSAP